MLPIPIWSASPCLVSSAFASISDPVRLESGLAPGPAGQDPQVRACQGLPYAAPPAGNLRWQPAAPRRRSQSGSVWTILYAGRRGTGDTEATMIKMALPFFAAVSLVAQSQLSPSASWAVHTLNEYQIAPNITYLTASNVDLKLDVYSRRGATAPQPTLIYMHGGFWVAGAKEGALMSLMPWLEMGWNVVNVEYRLGQVALAPAAVEDCMCALKWVVVQAKTYNFDPNRIVVMGESAGGHLALAVGMIPESAGLDQECASPTRLPKVAAVINWFGVTDVGDVIQGEHKANAAARWFGSLPNKDDIARRISPLTYVRPGLPPIMTIHGDADPTVPYQHAVRLHDALKTAGVENWLVTVPGGRHGNFTPDERTRIYVAIREFLTKNGLPANN